MDQQLPSHSEPYLAAFKKIEETVGFTGPDWAQSLRKKAISQFTLSGFPTNRRGNEEWKYTDISPIAKGPFYPILECSSRMPTANVLDRFTFCEPTWHRLVFVDGSYCQELSSVSALPKNVAVLNLVEAMANQDSLVKSHLGSHADFNGQPFTALNTAFVNNGAFVRIPDNTLVQEPIQVLFLFSPQAEDTVSHPRTLVVVGKNSEATLIESYGGLSENRYFSNSVTEVVLGKGAKIQHYRIQQHSKKAFHIGTTQVELGRDSKFLSVTTDLGGGLVRNNLNALTAGEGCFCRLNGIYLMNGVQHVDNQVVIDHAKPDTSSRELYKGILDEKSRSVFHGSIIVRKGAQKVNAHQEDKNLLLSNEAEADTKPAFWIYADDVLCGHGAACGQLDENALFYLRSRGVGEARAREILTRAFLTEVIDSIATTSIRKHIDNLVTSRLELEFGQNDQVERLPTHTR